MKEKVGTKIERLTQLIMKGGRGKVSVTGMCFFPSHLLNCFQLFPSKQNSESCRTESEQVRNGPDEKKGGGCSWFQLFFIDFQLFYYLFRIIHDVKLFIAALNNNSTTTVSYNETIFNLF